MEYVSLPAHNKTIFHFVCTRSQFSGLQCATFRYLYREIINLSLISVQLFLKKAMKVFGAIMQQYFYSIHENNNLFKYRFIHRDIRDIYLLANVGKVI